MGKRVGLVVLVALASLQVLQALGLEKTPLPDYSDVTSKSPVASRFTQSDSWAASTQWMGALRSSYSQILRYETDVTLARMMDFASNIEAPTQKYKELIEDILADIDKPSYSMCTRDRKVKRLQEMVSTQDQHLQKCATRLKTLHEEYNSKLENLSAEVDSQSEEAVYTPCLSPDSTVTPPDSAGKCFYARVQAALSDFYYPMGATVLRTVTEFRSSIAHARDVAFACAQKSALRRAANAQAISQFLEETTSCLNSTSHRVRRGFGKKFKKFFKKAKNGIKKVCSKVPCQIGYSVPFG